MRRLKCTPQSLGELTRHLLSPPGRTTAKDLSDVEEDPLEEEEEEDGQGDPDYVGDRHDVGDVPETPVDPSSAEKPVESSPSDQKPKPKIKSRKRANKEVQGSGCPLLLLCSFSYSRRMET